MIENKGLYLDCEPIDQPPGTWRDARNIVMSKKNGAYSNEDGTERSAKAGTFDVFSSPGYPVDIAEPIGYGIYPDNYKVIFSAGINGGKDRIGVMNRNDVYKDLIVDDILNFRRESPIRSAEIDYNYLGQRIVAWTDQFNSPRILNIDNLPFSVNINLTLSNSEDWKKTEVFPKFKTPQIYYSIFDSGGALLAGNYSIFIAYENVDGTKSPYSIPLHNINITDDSVSVGANKFDGVAPGSLTSKAIELNLVGLDTTYDKVIIGVVYRTNNQIIAKEVKKINISSPNIFTKYIGTETTVDINLEELLTTRPTYNKTGCMTQLNSVLYHGNLEAEEDIDFQANANNVKIYYTTKLVNIDDLNNSQGTANAGGFAHGGVYAFYIHLILKNGSLTRGFHIPGRISVSNDKAISTLATSAGLPSNTMKYQVQGTTDVENPAYTDRGNGTRGVLNIGSNITSNMGFWENKDEVYPVGFPGLAGKRVRHHVFPSIQEMSFKHYQSEPAYGTSKLDILAIDVSNVIIPSNIQDKVSGWIISYAQRDYANSNILGTDLLLHAASVESDSNRIWSSGGNWNIDARQASGDGDAVWGDDVNMIHTHARGHCFDLLRDKPQINSGGLFLFLERALINPCSNSRYQHVGITGGVLADSGEGAGQNAGILVDYRASNMTTNFVAGNNIRKIQDAQYLPNGIINGRIWTIKNEETIHYEIIKNGLPNLVTPTKIRVNSSNRVPGTPYGETSIPEETFIITYRQLRDNLYANYDQQLLTLTNKITHVGTTQQLFVAGGDVFLSLRSFISSAPRFGADVTGPDGITVIRAHIAEGRYNERLRYEVPGNQNSKYYPKTSPTEFWSNSSDTDSDGTVPTFSRFSNINEPVYSNVYNSTNDLVQPIIYNPDQINSLTNKFPYRVIKSGFSGTNAQGLNSWKTYLSNDYYDSNRNRGEIENIVSIDDVLLIHHKHGIFRTLNTEKLSVGSTEVYLGTGDIFSQAPKEPISTKIGYLGNQNIFASFTFKGTYVWVDQSQGRIFTINKQGVTEISTHGLNNFFRDNTIFISGSRQLIQNNPITGNCIIGGYDPKFRRLLFTKNVKTLLQPSFTLSYSLDNNCWVCFHDYVPNLYMNDTNNLFSFRDKAVYKHNIETVKGKYLGINTIYPSYIDIVHSFKDKAGKLLDVQFFNLNWITTAYKNGVLQRNKTLTHITANTSYQSTPKITLIPQTKFGIASNIRRINNVWNFNRFKVTDNNPLKRKPLVDKYCIVRYEYDNIPDLDNDQLSLYWEDLSCNARPATA